MHDVGEVEIAGREHDAGLLGDLADRLGRGPPPLAQLAQGLLAVVGQVHLEPGQHADRPALLSPRRCDARLAHRRPYATKDGYLCALVYNDKQWRAFYKLISKSEAEFEQDERINTHANRAGRRGLDIEGHGVVLYQPGMNPREVAGLASTRTYPLRSSFRPWTITRGRRETRRAPSARCIRIFSRVG